MDGQTYVPQHREHIMIVSVNRGRYHGDEQFQFPEQYEKDCTIVAILDPNSVPKTTLAA